MKSVASAVMRSSLAVAGVMVYALLSSCATPPVEPADAVVEEQPQAIIQPAPAAPPVSAPQIAGNEADDAVIKSAAPAEGIYKSGHGRFVNASGSANDQYASGDVTLNFENTSLQEVIKVILGDLLGENYVIDPKVKGTVTLQTSRPFASSALMPVLEMLLGNNGAALVNERGLYRIVTLDDALKLGVVPQVGVSEPLPAGFQIRIVPLQYVAAEEMKKILEPLSRPQNIVSIDTQRNLLVLSGTPNELHRLLQTVAMFDVDWLEGMSFALFTPSYVDARTLADELKNIFGEGGNHALAGLVRIVPIERLNALLVVTARASYLKKVEQWVERLDLETAGSGRRLFVYHVQNGKATELADVLSKIFEKSGSREKIARPALAPGLEPAEIQSRQDPEAGLTPAPRTARIVASADEGLALQDDTSIRIIADEINNTLLILATAIEYRMVKAALGKMDTVPLQVLIEATIAEITLTDELQYGLQWYFKNSHGGYRGTGVLGLVGDTIGVPPIANAFTYTITSAGAVRALLTAKATESKVDIISSPSLMVLNNQKASIQVGDQVPIETQSQSTISGGTTLFNSFEYRDTGILLTVTPRVNAGGLITMEIEQEASNVKNPLADGNPTITQRKIKSVVAVKSGETIVLGGLIDEQTTHSRTGVPLLHTLPLVGNLFGKTVDDTNRRELVVLLTPRAINNAADAQAVTDEFREKMKGLKPFDVFKRSEKGYQGLQLEQSLQTKDSQ